MNNGSTGTLLEQIRVFHKLSTELPAGVGPGSKGTVMTAFAASLFALAALVSAWIIAATWARYGRDALALRARLEACPRTTVVVWKMIERVPVPSLATLRTDRKVRPVRLPSRRPGLEWPGAALQPLELAA